MTVATIEQTEKRPRGRVGPRLDDQIHDRIVAAVLSGMQMTAIGPSVGLHSNTLFKWLAKGEDSPAGTRMRRLFDEVNAARAEVERFHLDVVRRAAEGGYTIRRTTRTLPDRTVEEIVETAPPDWRAAGWFLERAFPDRWGRKAQVALTGADGGPVQVHIEGLHVAAARIAEAIEARRSEDAEGFIDEADVIEEPTPDA